MSLEGVLASISFNPNNCFMGRPCQNIFHLRELRPRDRVFHSFRPPISKGAGISSQVLMTPRTSQHFTLIDLFFFFAFSNVEPQCITYSLDYFCSDIFQVSYSKQNKNKRERKLNDGDCVHHKYNYIPFFYVH